jgi:hypothetical protein
MRAWLRRLLGDDGADLALKLPSSPQADPPLFCAMPEEPWRERRDDERICGRIRSPYRPTCRRAACLDAYGAALDSALRSEARRRAAEERVRAERGVLEMPRRASR